MKKIISILVFALIFNNLQSQTAKVKRIQGKEVYILAQPVRSYELLNERTHQRTAKMFQKDGAGKQTISTKVETYLRKLLKQSKKEGFEFDAVLYEDGKYAYPIKYTDTETAENSGMAKVSRINGIPVFIMNEPVEAYSIVSDKRHKVQMKSALSMGWSKNNIREDVEKFTKRFRKQFKDDKIDALYYNYGNRANGISFSI